MNKASNNHYSLLLQDETETDGIGIEEEEEEEAEDGLNGMEEEEDDDEDEEEEEEEEEDENEAEEDSDEEEIFSSSKHRTLSHHEGANLNGQNHIGGHGNEYRLLNNNDADLKTVLDTPITIWTPTPMSPARRACFIASIMFGVLVVATFLWVLPCDVQPCEGDMGLGDREWAVKMEGMGINQTKQVRRLSGGHNILLSYYMASNISGWDLDNSSLSDDEPWIRVGDGQCGLRMLDGNLGRENWRVPLRECPVDLQCDLLDVSGDRVPDCIVRGGNTMLFMIEARFGTVVWHLHEHKEESSVFPGQDTTQSSRSVLKFYKPGPALLLPDVNNDSFGDLLFSGLLSSKDPHLWDSGYGNSEPWNQEEMLETQRSPSQTNHLVLVCGQSGSILGKPLVLIQCVNILTVTWDGEGIAYSCVDFGGASMKGKIHLVVLLHQIMGKDAPSPPPSTVPESAKSLHRHPVHTQHRDPCHITVHNQGLCPSCESQIRLFKANEQMMHKHYKHSAVVSWATLLSDGECHGAVLKIWEWKHLATVVKTAKPPPQIVRRTTRSSLVSDSDTNVETEPTRLEVDNIAATQGDSSSNFNIANESNMIIDIPRENTFKQHLQDAQLGDEESKPVPNGYPDLEVPTTPVSPRLRRGSHISRREPQQYEHPTIHRHHGKQTSGTQEDYNHHSDFLHYNQPYTKKESETRRREVHDSLTHRLKLVSTTSATNPSPIPVGMRTMPPSVLAPPGYQLQQIHERLVFLRYNGSVWIENTLTSLGITQLCKDEKTCLPDMESHSRSVAVNTGMEKNAWQLVSSSTTFVNAPALGEEQHTAPWILTSIVRKMIVHV